MEKKPLHVCQSLLNRITNENGVEIVTTLRLYYEHAHEVNAQVNVLVSRHFTRLLHLNHQVYNRILDDLLICLPFLGTSSFDS